MDVDSPRKNRKPGLPEEIEEMWKTGQP